MSRIRGAEGGAIVWRKLVGRGLLGASVGESVCNHEGALCRASGRGRRVTSGLCDGVWAATRSSGLVLLPLCRWEGRLL